MQVADNAHVEHPAVSVILLCYNQETTIAQTIDSVLGQRFSLPYEIIIGDDCSVDGTAQICRKYQQRYPERIRLISHPVNIGLVNNYCSLALESKAELLAICAGDDYWSSNTKLDVQFRYLNEHPECGFVHTNCHMLLVQHNTIVENSLPEGYLPTDRYQLLLSNHIAAPTVMIRTAIVKQAIKEGIFKISALMEDYPLWLYASEQAQIGFIADYTAVWRKSERSISQNKNLDNILRFDISKADIRYYFAKRQNWPGETKLSLVREYKKMLHQAFMLKEAGIVAQCFARLKEFGAVGLREKMYSYRIVYYSVLLLRLLRSMT